MDQFPTGIYFNIDTINRNPFNFLIVHFIFIHFKTASVDDFILFYYWGVLYFLLTGKFLTIAPGFPYWQWPGEVSLVY